MKANKTRSPLKTESRNLNRLKTALFLILFAAAGFLLTESLARLIVSYGPLFNRIRSDHESKWRLNWVRQHRESSDIAYDFDVYHPVRGWALKPGVRDSRVFGKKILNTNSKGVRGKREYDYSKSDGVSRILVLGDSFTFGEDVSDDETYPYYLEQLIGSGEVINMGVHGYAHDQMLLYLKKEGVRYRPDVVILGFLPYDMDRNLLGFRDYAKPKFVISGGRLKMTGVPVPNPESVIRDEVFRLKIFDLTGMLWEEISKRVGLYEKEKIKVSEALMDEIVSVTQKIPAIPVFVFLPNEIDFKDFFDQPTEREEFLFNYCKSRAIHCLSARPAFIRHLKEGNEVVYFGHWDAAGHRLAANAIAEYLSEKGLLTMSGERSRDVSAG